MPADIFEEAKRRPDVADDACDVRPEMARVFVAEFSSRDTEGLARIAAMDDIHASTPRFAVEGGNIVPDRRAIQGLVFHPCHKSGRRIGVPLDVTDSSIGGDGDVEAEIEATCARAEGEAAQDLLFAAGLSASGGRYSHAIQSNLYGFGFFRQRAGRSGLRSHSPDRPGSCTESYGRFFGNYGDHADNDAIIGDHFR